MKKITQEELNIILEEHKNWLADKNNGKRANLRNADLIVANFRNADLSNANLSDADLSYADLSNTNLRNADLRNANLSDADLNYADLRNADLSYADLSYADLNYADLRNADLSYAKLRSCIGNGKQIKTIYIDKYIINYTTDILSIGCEQHSIEVWKNFTKEKIAKMENNALKWWKKWKKWIFNTIKLSPAEK